MVLQNSNLKVQLQREASHSETLQQQLDAMTAEAALLREQVGIVRIQSTTQFV